MNRGVWNAARAMAAVGLLAMLAGAWLDPEHAARSWLTMFTATASTWVGALVLLMITHVVQGQWLRDTRRVQDAVVACLPVVALLFVPVLLARGVLFPWAQDAGALDAEMLQAVRTKGAYLGTPFFVVRAALVLGLWCTVGVLLVRGTAGRRLAAGALPAVGLSIHFAAVDWVMSLDPRWASSMFGVYVFVGGLLSGTALVVVLARVVQVHAVPVASFHQSGKMLLGLVAFWGYIGFAQFLLVWMANLPDEANWYRIRFQGSWGAVAMLLLVGHFVLPLFGLLQTAVTTVPWRLAWLAGWLLVVHVVDHFWLTRPPADGGPLQLDWTDAAALVAVTGVLLAAVGHNLGTRPVPGGATP